MKSYEIENTFIRFFNNKNYVVFQEIPLLQKDDKTLLFTNSGMVQFKNIFLGNEKINAEKVVTSQTCVRVGGKHNDLQNIGESVHHNTSFTMLGNFGFKKVLKDNVMLEAWDFLIHELNLEKEKLYITVHNNDLETFNIWKKISGFKSDKIFFYSDDSNFWSMDKNGPCGYCTEIFYDISDNNNKNLLEIWNLVFIQFNKLNDKLLKLENMYLDTGMGLERITSVKQKCYNNFETDIYQPLIQILQDFLNISDIKSRSFRIIVDHLKTIVLLLKENVMPSNEKHGYVLKKLIRRTILEKQKLKISNKLSDIPNSFFLNILHDLNNISFIREVLNVEEMKFEKTLSLGTNYLRKILKNKRFITGKELFMLYDTYGLPLETIKKFSIKNNIKFELDEFNKEMLKQVSMSKTSRPDFNYELLRNLYCTVFTGYDEIKSVSKVIRIIVDNVEVNEIFAGQSGIIILDKTCFYSEKGGQIGDIGILKSEDSIFNVVDTQEIQKVFLHYGIIKSGVIKKHDYVNLIIDEVNRNNCAKNHSATHLLNAVLQNTLGSHVKQMGSLVTGTYLRFDFSHFGSLTKYEINLIEKEINNYIRMKLKVQTQIETDIKSGNVIRTVIIGDNVSKEFCAGTHVNNTENILVFKIIKEYGIGSNIRRVEAITGEKVFDYYNTNENILNSILNEVSCDKNNIVNFLQKVLQKNKELERTNFTLMSNELLNDINNNIIVINNINIVILIKSFIYNQIIHKIFSRLNNFILIIYFFDIDHPRININISKNIEIITALDIVEYLKTHFDLKGGGTKYTANVILNNCSIKSEKFKNTIFSYLESKLIK